MRKNIVCLSRSVSFLTANFIFFLRVSLIPALLFALSLTIAIHAFLASNIPVAIVGMLFALLAYLFVQSVVVSMWRAKEKGYAVDVQKTKSLYRSGLQKIAAGFSPKMWFWAVKYYFRHFNQMFSLSVCCFFVFSILSIVICLPVIAIAVIKWTVIQSGNMGDVVVLPGGLYITFYIVTFVVSYILSAILSPSILPFLLRKIECDREEAELEAINIK